MKTFFRILLVGLAIAAAAGACVWVLTDPGLGRSASASRPARASALRAEPATVARSDPHLPRFSDNYIDDSGYDLAFRYSAPFADRGSLAACYASAAGRSE